VTLPRLTTEEGRTAAASVSGACVAGGVTVGRLVRAMAELIGESVVMTIPVLSWIAANLTKTGKVW